MVVVCVCVCVCVCAGHGELIFNNGDHYTGTWSQDKATGQGPPPLPAPRPPPPRRPAGSEHGAPPTHARPRPALLAAGQARKLR